MHRLNLVQDCDRQLSTLLPQLPRPEQKGLAQLVSGIVLAESGRLSRASAATPGRTLNRSKQRRAQRLLANPRLDVASALPPLVARVLERRHGRLDVLLDATTVGASAQDPGTTTLMLALADHGRAQPLTWRTWRADQPGQDWAGTIPHLLAAVEAQRPRDTDPVLLADRGLGTAPLARQVSQLGWHYLLRVTRTTVVQLPDGWAGPIGDLVPEPGTYRRVVGARIDPPRRTVAGVVLLDWAAALVTNLVAVWRTDDSEAWLLITDLPPCRTRCTEYRHRTWHEELFRDLKSLGLDWGHSRVRRPERVERLLLALALAVLWLLALGQRVLRRGQRRQLDDRRRRTLSRFQLGLSWLRRLLATDQPLECVFHFWSVTLAFPKLS